MDCLEDNTLAALAAGLLSQDQHRAALEHLDGCAACGVVLAEVADPERRPLHALLCEPGDRVGRYAIIDAIGAGSSGVVYAAYDPDLDRRVALKLLLSPPSPAAEARLRQEAQALGRLSHEAVVAVHDVGEDGGRLFIAMDLVDGWPLRQWLRRQDRSLREVLRVLCEAGQGLAAAHAAGVLHQDFKPDNVLCGRDGHARVSDFGLAQLLEDTKEGAEPTSTAESTGGTPAYMAPEQWRGEITAKTDQFSFAVTLYEAVYGERPFTGSDDAALRAAVERGPERRRPAGRRAPRWLHRVLLRALAPDQADRFPSMEVLVGALRAGSPLRRHGLVAAVAAFAAALSAVAYGGLQRAPLARCLSEGRRSAQALPAALQVAWRREWRGGCLETHLFRERPSAVWERQAVCLELLRAEALAGAGAATDGRWLARCGPDLAGAARGWPPLAGSRALLSRLATARARLAYADAEAVRAQARTRGFGALEAEALLVMGLAQGQGPGAAATFKEALWTAQAARHDHAAAEALVRLIRALPGPERAAQRRLWRGYAEAALQRIGGDAALEALLRGTAG